MCCCPPAAIWLTRTTCYRGRRPAKLVSAGPVMWTAHWQLRRLILPRERQRIFTIPRNPVGVAMFLRHANHDPARPWGVCAVGGERSRSHVVYGLTKRAWRDEARGTAGLDQSVRPPRLSPVDISLETTPEYLPGHWPSSGSRGQRVTARSRTLLVVILSGALWLDAVSRQMIKLLADRATLDVVLQGGWYVHRHVQDSFGHGVTCRTDGVWLGPVRVWLFFPGPQGHSWNTWNT